MTVLNALLKLKIWSDHRGQDLIEYALMAGFVAVVAGAIMPDVATSISTIFSKIASTMTEDSGSLCSTSSSRIDVVVGRRKLSMQDRSAVARCVPCFAGLASSARS